MTKLTAPQIKALVNLAAVGGRIGCYLENFQAAKVNGNAVWGLEKKKMVEQIIDGEEEHRFLVITEAGRAYLDAMNV